ncbi:uncharacterized protein LOC111618027 [Centruroides sculpturatus]|uniref:uncharacterized protein LOC111618027 n=1 Tax=Centruroides sculpturatus TaxID=218467 RepID=UPI000C6E44D1|nr:uncharacterized protein LOC111618027 [Centruroides sculpturatus]
MSNILLNFMYPIKCGNLSIMYSRNIKNSLIRSQNLFQHIKRKSVNFQRCYKENHSVLKKFWIFMKQKADGKFLIKFSSSTLITWKLVNQRISVSCEVKAEHKSRLFGIDKDIMQETKFDWKQFFDLLKPEIWHMIIAVLSAIAVAYYNIQIPVLLGDVVNVVSRFVSCSGQTEIGNFFQQIKNPCLRLLHIYLAQISYNMYIRCGSDDFCLLSVYLYVLM